MKSNKRRQGFTVLELMIAMLLGALIIAGAYYIFVGQQRGLQQVSETANSVQMGRLTIEQLNRELHMAGFGVVTGESFTEAKKYALTFIGDIDTDIDGVLAENAAAGATQIKINLNDARDKIERGDRVFINGGGNVELIQVAQSGDVVDFSGEPDTIRLSAGLQHSYTATQTLVRTIESVRYEVVFPGGNLRRNGVLLAEGLNDLEFHYYNDAGAEMTPDAVNGLSQIERAAVRRIELRLDTGGTAGASHPYSESIDLRNMGARPYKIDTCAPAAPSNLVISNTGMCEHFTATWTPPTTNACDGSALTDLGGYKLYYGTAAGDYFLPAANVSDETLTTYTVDDPRLTNGTTYHVVLRAYDSSFNESTPTADLTFTLNDTTAPHAPASLDATAGAGLVTLTWTKPEDADVKGYRVYRGTTPGFAMTSDKRIADETTLGPETLSFGDSTGQTCVTYYYKVTAVDCANESVASPEAYGDGAGSGGDYPTANVTNTTATESPAQPPAAPSPVVAIGRDQSVEMLWTNPSAADFAAVIIRYSTSSYPTSPTDGLEVGRYEGPAGQAMTHTVTGLVNGIRYYFSIFAVDRCGNVSTRATANATPSQTAPVVAIVSPADGATISNGQIVFQARAYDPDKPGVGNPPSLEADNGKGIVSMRFWATPDPGTLQFPRVEYLKEYCGFSGDSNPCPAGDVTQWCDGAYQLYASATDDESQQSPSPYVTVAIRNGGLYVDQTVAPATTGTYRNEVTFGLENTGDSDLTILSLTFTWSRTNARLSRIQIPDGSTIWQNATTPANTGEVISLSLGSRPTLAGHAKTTVRLTFMQMYTTLSAAAAAGATQLAVQSTDGFAVGDAAYVTDGTHTEYRTVLSVSSGVLGLSSGLTYAYASGAAVRHQADASNMPMSGADLRVVFGYQKAVIIGRTCTSDQAQISLSAAPILYELQQDMPAVNTACTTALGQIQIENYRTVPVHAKVTDTGGVGIANVKVYYNVDNQFKTTAPTSGYTSLTATYNSPNSRWEATIPYQSGARVWLYFVATDNNAATDRSPSTGAYAYDYVTDTTAPVCPLGLMATKMAKKRIDLSWSANSETDVIGYNIYRKHGAGAFSKVYTRVTDQDAGAPGVQYSDTDNNLNTDNYCYTYYVTAVDMQGNESSPCSSYTASAGKSPCP